MSAWQWIAGSMEFVIAFAYTGWPKRLHPRG